MIKIKIQEYSRKEVICSYREWWTQQYMKEAPVSYGTYVNGIILGLWSGSSIPNYGSNAESLSKICYVRRAHYN